MMSVVRLETMERAERAREVEWSDLDPTARIMLVAMLANDDVVIQAAWAMGDFVHSDRQGGIYRLFLDSSDPARMAALLHGIDPWGQEVSRLVVGFNLDDGSWWSKRVPAGMRTVAEALAWLEPDEVKAARMEGRTVLRQGDVYAVESKEDAVIGKIPKSHRWDPEGRTLTHHPEYPPAHAELHVPFRCTLVRQRAMPPEPKAKARED